MILLRCIVKGLLSLLIALLPLTAYGQSDIVVKGKVTDTKILENMAAGPSSAL